MVDLEFESDVPAIHSILPQAIVGQIDRNRFNVIPRRDNEDALEGEVIMGRYFKQTDSLQKNMIYVGSSERFLQVLSLNTASNYQLFQYSPDTLSLIPAPPPKRSLMQRYALLEKVKDAQVIGILIGSVVVDGYLDIINSIKLSAARAGKKSYEVLIGKLNEPKLKNFQFVRHNTTQPID